MTTFLSLSPVPRAVLIALFALSAVGLLLLLMQKISRFSRTALPAALLLLLTMLEILGLQAAHRSELTGVMPDTYSAFFGGLPVFVHILALVFLYIVFALALYREIAVSREMITPGSIREATDDLPSGLCFSKENGTLLLVNRRMQQLYRELTGHSLQNGEEMWEELCRMMRGHSSRVICEGDSPVLTTPSGQIWRFSRSDCVIRGTCYKQVIATDITQLYTLLSELETRNTALDEQQQRLKSLLGNIAQIRREEEMLASKVNIHDNFGRCVLATRRWLTAELPDQPVEEILDVWSDVLNKINNDSISEERTDSDMQRELEDAAAVLGCAIYFEGTLPQERHTAYLILTAVREAVTNAVRHAGASQVTVRLREDGGFVFACITDNGEKRVSRITEGGGLSGLRKKIERAGGRLEIVLCGGVQLRVSLPLPKGAG